jgi:uncharacterized protein
VNEEDKKIVYVMTHGTDTPERSATPFYLASSAAAMDVAVSIFFTINGPTLLVKGVADKLVPKKDGKGAPLRQFIDQASALGVQFYVCQPSLDLNNLCIEDLIDGVEIIGGAAFNDMALEADTVISF